MKLPMGEYVVWNTQRPDEADAHTIREYSRVEISDEALNDAASPDRNGGKKLRKREAKSDAKSDAKSETATRKRKTVQFDRLKRFARKFKPAERTFHQIVRNTDCYLRTSAVETDAFVFRRNRFIASASNVSLRHPTPPFHFSSSSKQPVRRGTKRLDVNSTCILHSLPYSTNVTIKNTATQGNIRCIANEQYLNESGVDLPDGTGIVGVSIDTGVDVNHAFFYDYLHPVTYVTYYGNAFPPGSVSVSDHPKIKMYIATGANAEFRRDFDRGHGSHTAGINVGFPVSSFTGGMNPGAKLIVVDSGGDISSPNSLSIPDNLIGIFETAVNYGAVYSTNSWGSDSPLYDAFSYQFDAFAHENRHFTHVVSAGNSGGPTMLTSPANCKNCLVVGATMISPEGHRDRYYDVDEKPEKYQWNDLVSFTSYGTTIDGRTMPNVWTAGVDVYSASADPVIDADTAPHMRMRFSSGTSMAAPALPIARLYQLMETARNNTVPSSSLIRAVVMANTVSQVGPTVTGSLYTNPLASRASSPGLFGVFHPKPGFWSGPLRNWVLLDDLVVPSGDNYRVCYASRTLSDFVVVLAWTDPPFMGSDSAASYLVNDLDLVVNAFENSTWYGNMHTRTDTLHNHEIVRFSNPRNSTIRITVSDIGASSQEFSLAIYSQSGLEEIPCNGTCTDTELAVECDYENGIGVHFCAETGEWDRMACHPYACLGGRVFAGNGDKTCVTPSSPPVEEEDEDGEWPACRVRSGDGMNVSGVCMVRECDESYYFNGTGCTCYGAKSSGSGLRLACLSTGVFASPPAVKASGSTRYLDLSALLASLLFIIFTLF